MPEPVRPPDRETIRLHQANERTLLAWMRTALAMMGFGFVVARFGIFLRELAAVYGQQVPGGFSWSLWIGLGLSLLGVTTVVFSLLRFGRITASIERHEVGAPGGSGWIYLIGALTVVVGIAIVLLLLATR